MNLNIISWNICALPKYLNLFGDDYVNYKPYFTEGWLLHVAGKVKKKFYNDDLEFKISSINLLSDIIDKEVRDIVLRLDINDVSDSLVEEISSLVSRNSGKHSLLLNIVDSFNKYEVNLLARKAKVNLDKDFMRKINSLHQIQMKVK